MSSKDIIVFVAAFTLAGFSIYRRYLRKNKAGNTDNKNSSSSLSRHRRKKMIMSLIIRNNYFLFLVIR